MGKRENNIPMFEKMIEKSGFWANAGPFSDIVLSTRVRFARNLPSLYFPNKLDKKGIEIINSISERFVNESAFCDDLNFIELKNIDINDKRFLRERNLITSEMETSDDSSIVIEVNENFVILLNEEDHFRIQVIKPGFQIMDAYRLADRIDDELNKFVSYAYSDDLGYLTACPSNLGTGLRVSSMVHLPTLSMLNKMQEIFKVVKKMSFEIKGTTGDDYKTIGSIYIISNRISLGISEVDLIEELDEITSKIFEFESEMRDSYISEHGNQFTDRIWRAYGILKYSRRINFVEAMEHLSSIRVGIILSIIKNISLFKVNDLMVNIQRAHLQKIANKLFTSTLECDGFRAEYLRKQFT
jgi:protein arginine kinase